jgi:hypothetical protein
MAPVFYALTDLTSGSSWTWAERSIRRDIIVPDGSIVLSTLSFAFSSCFRLAGGVPCVDHSRARDELSPSRTCCYVLTIARSCPGCLRVD